MKDSRPILITYIVDLNFLNAFLLLVSLFPKLTEGFGLIMPTHTLANVISRILIIVILLIISYGLLRLKPWAFWLMLAYNVFFLIVSIITIIKPTGQSFNYLGLIVSIFGLSLILSAKRYFLKVKQPI
jgi:uncharacterized membrane protein (DUF2068 family)